MKAGAPTAATLASRPGLEKLKTGEVRLGWVLDARHRPHVSGVLSTLDQPGASRWRCLEARIFGEALAKLPRGRG